MKNEQLDQMFETIYGPYASARCAMHLHDALDILITAVHEYQDAHNPPTCYELDEALGAASVASREYGDNETVETEFHKRGLELIKYHQLRREDYFRQQQEQERQEAQKAKAKPKTKKKANAA
jgi:hypothetical protein